MRGIRTKIVAGLVICRHSLASLEGLVTCCLSIASLSRRRTRTRFRVLFKSLFRTFWMVLKTHQDLAMKHGLMIHLKSLRPRREIVN